MAESKQMPERILAKADGQHEINLHGEWYHHGSVVTSMGEDGTKLLNLTEYRRADLAPRIDGLSRAEAVNDLVQWAMDRPAPLAAISDHKAWIAEARRILKGDTP